MEEFQITSDFAESVQATLGSAKLAWEEKLNYFEGEVGACAEKCAELEAKAATLEGEAAGNVFGDWRAATQAKEFAAGRLRAFLTRYPDATAFEDAEYIKRLQALDEALARRAVGMNARLGELHETIVNARSALLSAVDAIEALGDDHARLIELAEAVRSRLTPEERVVMPQVIFNPIFEALDFKIDIRNGVGSSYLKNTMAARRPFREEE